MCRHCHWGEFRFVHGPGHHWKWVFSGPPWAWHVGVGMGWTSEMGFIWPFGPTKAQRRRWLEAFKQHLEELLADVNEELSKMQGEASV